MNAVLITTSGTGSRLKPLTDKMNKALVPIGRKASISYIIDAYPKDTQFVVTLGYHGNQVRDFLEIAYPNHSFEFVTIDKYEGPGTSLGYSMLQAKSYLQRPFIFHACDTIVAEKIPPPDQNWIGGYPVNEHDSSHDLKQFRTHKIEDGCVTALRDKGEPDFQSVHIGLTGVKDYQTFWQTLQRIYDTDPENTGHSDVHAVDAMIKAGLSFEFIPFSSWQDTGNPENLKAARSTLGSNFVNLYKEHEAIFFSDDRVIKFFVDEQAITDRVQRAHALRDIVPPILDVRKQFYTYRFTHGQLYADVAEPHDFKRFLEWSKQNLWKENDSMTEQKFKETCREFYETKTVKRIKDFFEKKGIRDDHHIINGEEIPTVSEILSQIDFGWLSHGKQSRFHGDFILDNIIKTQGGYTLIDWRQNFGGNIQSGDMYYDFAKLNHNLTVNHGVIHQNLFTVDIRDSHIRVDILRKDTLVKCNEVLMKFLLEEKLDTKKVHVLTGIVWLNMAPLHHHPFDLFLHYFGKLHLWQTLQMS